MKHFIIDHCIFSTEGCGESFCHVETENQSATALVDPIVAAYLRLSLGNTSCSHASAGKRIREAQTCSPINCERLAEESAKEQHRNQV
jgi:hypothetical protein